MKTALVTGGAGFLGSHLCERLLNEGYRVVAIDNLYTGSRANMRSFAKNKNFTFVKADVTDLRTGDARLKTKFDEIYNLACPASPVHYQAKPFLTTMTSIRGALLCLELAQRDGAKMLHCSTSEVYGDPIVHPQEEHYWGNVNTIGIRSCYDEGKRVAETLIADAIRTSDVDARMVRIFNTYGPRMHPQDGRVISNFVMQALRNEDITLFGDGEQTRSFQYCDDLIDAIRLYMDLPRKTIDDFFGGKSDRRDGGRLRRPPPARLRRRQHRQPRRIHHPRARRGDAPPDPGVDVEARVRAAAGGRSEAPQTGHHAGEGAPRLGAEGAARGGTGEDNRLF